MKKVYLAGPMSGHENLNMTAFDLAADALRGQGHFVFSPADFIRENGGEETPSARRLGLGVDLSWICFHADAVALLPGWQESRGATAERAAALAIGLEVWEL